MQIVIKFENIKKVFKKRPVLDGVDLEIKKNDIFGIVGMSGSGKTTLLKTLIGFITPDDGDIKFMSSHILGTRESTSLISIYNNINEVKRSFGFAPQNPSFYPKLTIEENLDYFSSLYGIPKDARQANINELLDVTELDKARNVLAQDISFGMQKRLGIACALVHKPSVFILDEPTADLDPVLRKQTWKLIRKINEQGTTIIVASHFLEEMEPVCDKMAILHNGQIKKIGTPAQLRTLFTKSDVITLETSPGKYDNIIEHLKKSWALPADKIINKHHQLLIYTPQAEKVVKRLLTLLPKLKEKLVDIDVNKPSLNDVFETFVKDN